MKFEEIKDMTVKELNKKTLELRRSLFEMRMKNTMGQLNNPLQVRFARRSIARILTALKLKNSQGNKK